LPSSYEAHSLSQAITVTATRPTILQIIPELDTGGAELSAIEIAEAIVRAGGRALVLSEGGRLASHINAFGGEFVPFPARTKNPVRMLVNARAIAGIVRAEGVDLIHARSRAPAWSALRAARATGKPFVTTYHGAYNENGRLKNLYNSVMARGDVVIANSQYTASLVKQRYGTPDQRIRVIHRGVDGAAFDPVAVSDTRKRELRAKWGVEPRQRIILQAARLTGWKGQRVTIDAARRLHQAGRLQDAVFVLAGDDQGRGGYRAELVSLIAASGLDHTVRLVGHVEDMPAAFALAHLTVIASTEPEAFGRTSTEAQAMGCPVIATAIGAPPETVLWDRADPRGMAGWLVPPGDGAAMAEAIEQALALSAERRAEMGARARAHALSGFSLQAMRTSTLQVYDSLLGTRLASR
jgi:glycosyltransferase involved in cell wall biosynthesis